MRIRLMLAAFGLLAAGCVSETSGPKGEPSIVYRVVDASGVPVAKARGFWILDQRPARDAVTAVRMTAGGATDSAGRLRLPAPPRGVEGYLSVWVETTGGPECVDEGVYPQGDGWTVNPEPYQIPEKDRWFRIHVEDAEGKPVAGATARFCWSADGAPLPFLPVLRGDARGFLGGGPFAYGSFWADLEAPDHAPLRVCPYQFPEEDGADREQHYFGPIVLPPARVVRGRVTADGLPPPPGVWLRCSYASTKENEDCEWYLPLGPAGEFEVVVRADAPWTLEAGSPGRGTVSRRFDSESEVTLNLPLPR